MKSAFLTEAGISIVASTKVRLLAPLPTRFAGAASKKRELPSASIELKSLDLVDDGLLDAKLKKKVPGILSFKSRGNIGNYHFLILKFYSRSPLVCAFFLSYPQNCDEGFRYLFTPRECSLCVDDPSGHSLVVTAHCPANSGRHSRLTFDPGGYPWGMEPYDHW